MASSKYITWSGIGLRFLFAALLVFTTYNPHKSYFHLVANTLEPGYEGGFPIGLIFFGIVLLIGWTIFIRATVNSLGMFGFILASAFFISFFALLINWHILSLDSSVTLSYMILLGTSGVLTVGISWSHIRRRLTGQLDVDDIDDEQ